MTTRSTDDIGQHKRKTICLDFDGVLHGYSRGWDDGTIYDPPVPGAVEAVQRLAENYRLVIATCREDIQGIWNWLSENSIMKYVADVTNSKPVASVYIDDRAVRFEGDWTATVETAEALMAGRAAIAGPGGGTWRAEKATEEEIVAQIRVRANDIDDRPLDEIERQLFVTLERTGYRLMDKIKARRGDADALARLAEDDRMMEEARTGITHIGNDPRDDKVARDEGDDFGDH